MSINSPPPKIEQHFNEKLLSVPCPKLRDSTETFDQMWCEALKLWKKVENNPIRKQKCELLKQEILELYERAKAKEKERESQKDHKTKGFMYSVAIPKGLAQDVYARLRFRRKAGSFSYLFRRNDAFRKIQKR